MATREILIAVTELFIMLIPGFVFGKKNLISEEQQKGIASIVVNFTWPCLIISCLQMDFSRELCLGAGAVICGLCIVMAVSFIISFITAKISGMNKGKSYLFTFMLMFANTGFMGIPVASALYGAEGVFYMALFDSLGDIFVFTAGIALIRKSAGGESKTNYKELISPGTIAILIGAVLFLSDTKLPELIGNPISAAGAVTTPLAMFILGFQLGKIKIKEILGDRYIYLLAVLKLAVVPLIFLMGVKMILPEQFIFGKVIIMAAALPVATCTVIFTDQYGGDVKFTTKGVLFTTLLSLISIPIFAVLV